MTPNTRFAAVAALDVAPVDCYAVYEGLAASIRESYSGLATMLQQLDDGSGTRLADVIGNAPQVLTTAAGYRWLNAAYETIARNNRLGLQTLVAQFGRFEAAAAVSTGASYEGAFPFDSPVTLPGTGTVVMPADATLSVVRGEPQAQSWILPLAGSLLIDGFESLLRSPRSMAEFGLEEPSRETAQRCAEELAAARDLADQIVPSLFDRYITDVVPLVAKPGIAHAGTDDAAPWAVYLSFGREPADLIAALAHEESHALVQTLAKLVPDLLPDSELDMPVPWKPGVRRSLSGVLHGLIAFGRAATVRSRAARVGQDSPTNAEAFEREYGWVQGVTEELQRGSLGELPDGLEEWLQSNLRAVNGTAAKSTESTVVLALNGNASDVVWRLLGGAAPRNAAGELFPQVLRSRWARGVPGYPDQDRADLDASTHRFLAHDVPALIEREWDVATELASVKVHRLRTGNHIRPHTDAQHGGFRYRLVLGLTPHDLRSGELRLLTIGQEPIVATQPQFGQALLFELTDPSYHEVIANQSAYPRFTLIASYRPRM